MANGDGPGAFGPGRGCMTLGGCFRAVGGKGTELQKQQQHQEEVGLEGQVQAQLLTWGIIGE